MVQSFLSTDWQQWQLCVRVEGDECDGTQRNKKKTFDNILKKQQQQNCIHINFQRKLTRWNLIYINDDLD